MHHSAAIVIYGRDSSLLALRKLVLEPSGYFVRVTTSAGTLRDYLDDSFVDLLLLCQTLPTKEANELVKIAHTAWPWTNILAMQGGRHDAKKLILATWSALSMVPKCC